MFMTVSVRGAEEAGMKEVEYIQVSNLQAIQDAKAALRDCLPGYGLTEKEDRIIMKLLWRAEDRLWKVIKVEE